MERHKIVPKQVHEAEKRKIKNALTNQRSMRSDQSVKKEAPDFFKAQREELL